MVITFDLLDRFQENKVFQTAQTMNNILKSNTKLEVQKNTSLALIIQIMWLKQIFLKRAVVARKY